MTSKHFIEKLMRPGTLVNVVPPVLLTLVVLGAGLSPGLPRVPLGIEWGDKVEHAIVFSMVAYCYMRAARHIWLRTEPAMVHARAAWAAAGLGAALELFQTLVPYRSAELLDLVADVLGVMLTWVVVRFTHGPVAESHG